MRRKPTLKERQIAKALDISDAQLFGLLAVKARRGTANVGHHLEAKGLIAPNATYSGAARDYGRSYYGLTPAGEALLERARAMGY